MTPLTMTPQRQALFDENVSPIFRVNNISPVQAPLIAKPDAGIWNNVIKRDKTW